MPSMVTTLHTPSSRGGHYCFPFGRMRWGKNSSRMKGEGPRGGGEWKSPARAVLTGIKVKPQARPPLRGLRGMALTLWAAVLLAGEHLT